MDKYGDPASSVKATVPGGVGGSSSSNSSSIMGSNSPSYALNGKIMLCSAIVFFVALVVILGFHTYARKPFPCCRRRRSRHPSGLALHHAAAAALPGGLDVSVLKSLPTFTFYAAGGNPSNNLGDCPVCLSEFEDGETARALPKCGHAFHVECIDMWFQTHSNCPLCRAPVQAWSDANAPSTVPTAISLPSQGNENGNSGSSDSPAEEFVVISIETLPSMEERFRGLPEELGSGLGDRNGAKSPDNMNCHPEIKQINMTNVHTDISH
ncbi:hypothetical protein CDL15_Pgr010075 [Punica granatum]|uniref:RING-type E3 ubiquitin transferase n=1 Tax=Punica granatum TaxID=22663 RepID=A0A218X560_PUNGR|nr:hypothetical protein CDL15_Pgr010075 [Punica granatum]